MSAPSPSHCSGMHTLLTLAAFPKEQSLLPSGYPGKGPQGPEEARTAWARPSASWPSEVLGGPLGGEPCACLHLLWLRGLGLPQQVTFCHLKTSMCSLRVGPTLRGGRESRAGNQRYLQPRRQSDASVHLCTAGARTRLRPQRRSEIHQVGPQACDTRQDCSFPQV